MTTKKPELSESLIALKDYLEKFGTIDDESFEQLTKMIVVKAYPKNTILVHEGQMANKCYFVLKGLIRQFVLLDGEEKTTNFYLDGEPVTSTFSSDTEPAKFFLVCNEDTHVIEGEPGGDQVLLDQMPQMMVINNKAVESETKKMHDSLMTFKILSPEERYLKLIEEKPQLFNRVPLYQMASYLGVKPESLSRIRKRITKTKTS